MLISEFRPENNVNVKVLCQWNACEVSAKCVTFNAFFAQNYNGLRKWYLSGMFCYQKIFTLVEVSGWNSLVNFERFPCFYNKFRQRYKLSAINLTVKIKLCTIIWGLKKSLLKKYETFCAFGACKSSFKITQYLSKKILSFNKRMSTIIYDWWNC